MKEVVAKHEPYWETGHLGNVVEDMRTQGPPTIRVMLHDGKYYALEGSHRLAAAHHLGLTPNIVVEIPETKFSLMFWDKVARDGNLPVWTFDHLEILTLASFLEVSE